MKLLLLFDYYPPYIGGAETVNEKLAEHFHAAHHVVVFTKKFKGASQSFSQPGGVSVYRTANVPRFFHSFVCALRARHVARASDIIIAATYASAVAGWLLAQWFHKPCILLVHEVLGEHWRFFKRMHSLYRLYERFVVTRGFTHVIAFSRYTYSCLLHYGISPDKITIIPHGIDDELFSPRPLNHELRKQLVGDARFVYLYFGRPGGSKGLFYLLHAVPEILQALPQSKLMLILGSEPRSEYRKTMRLIYSLGIQDAVIVHPSVVRHELPNYINIADVVVIPSLSEGFGFSAAESCALGKPVVVTNTGSLPEVVWGKVITVKKADSAALAEGILRAYRGEYDVIPKKTFSWQDAFKKYDELLSTALSKRHFSH